MELASGSMTSDGIRALELERLRSLTEPDVAIAYLIHADDYELVTPGGKNLSREEYLGGISSGELNYAVFEPAGQIFVKVGDSMAAVRYTARIDGQFGDQGDAGLFWHTDIYELRSERWQAVWSQATRISTR